MSDDAPLKIIAIVDNELSAGGGFNQALNAILQMQRICENRYLFEVFSTSGDNLTYLNSLGLHAHITRFSAIDKLLARLSVSGWWRFIQARLKMIGPFEKELLEHGADLAYFVTPGSIPTSLQRLNYIATVWDLCHRDMPEFPEVRDFCDFYNREQCYANMLAPAVMVLTDSQRLAELASFRYGVDLDRFLAMPFAPSPLLEQANALRSVEVLQNHDLERDYFYYPAQFWAHKNHLRILEALLLLKSKKWEPTVVFSGKDCGNRHYIEACVNKYGLNKQVKILGFVPAADMKGLYEGSLAVLMPTYFGWTNLPPLEAWALGVPLIYSSHLHEQAGEAALLVDPDNSNELADAMLKCIDPIVRERLVEAGRQRLDEIAERRSAAEAELINRLNRFAARRRCWQ